MSKLKIRWQVDDGYAGGSRPQYSFVDKEEYDSCETEEEKQELVDTIVRQDFDNMGYYIENIEDKS